MYFGKYTFVLGKYTFVQYKSILLYFKSILLYFATMLASGCIEHQYSKGKEKLVMNVYTLKHANLLAVGDTTYAYFSFFFGDL